MREYQNNIFVLFTECEYTKKTRTCTCYPIVNDPQQSDDGADEGECIFFSLFVFIISIWLCNHSPCMKRNLLVSNSLCRNTLLDVASMRGLYVSDFEFLIMYKPVILFSNCSNKEKKSR